MDSKNTNFPIRLAIIQSRLAPFRVAFFDRLAGSSNLDVSIFCGGPSSLRNAVGPHDFTLRTLSTWSPSRGRLTIQRGLLSAICRGKFDVIVAEARLGLLMNPLVLALCKITRKRFLWWTCGWERDEMQAISNFKRWIRRMLFCWADGGVAYSNVAREYLVNLGMSADRVWVAYNSVDTDSLLAVESEIRNTPNWERELRKETNADGKRIILFVGKLTETKRVELLLEAFDAVHQKRPDCVLWIVGDGPERQRIEKTARDSGNAAIRFFGEVTEPKRINSLFLAADLFVLPGTGGLALNQAMTFGKPVVVSRADGTEEDLVIDGHNGLYFKPGDATDLAAKVLAVLEDEHRRTEMGKRSRERILKEINMRNMVESFCNAVLDRRPTSE